jgi:hypothetical protein
MTGPNKVHQHVQLKLAVILTYWAVISRPSFASQNLATKVLGREFALHKPP